MKEVIQDHSRGGRELRIRLESLTCELSTSLPIFNRKKAFICFDISRLTVLYYIQQAQNIRHSATHQLAIMVKINCDHSCARYTCILPSSDADINRNSSAEDNADFRKTSFSDLPVHAVDTRRYAIHHTRLRFLQARCYK